MSKHENKTNKAFKRLSVQPNIRAHSFIGDYCGVDVTKGEEMTMENILWGFTVLTYFTLVVIVMCF